MFYRIYYHLVRKPIESLKRIFHPVSGCFTPEQNAINRLIFTCSHRKKSLQERILCDSSERFTSVSANKMNSKILSSLQSLVWVSNVSLRKKWAGLVPYVVTSSRGTARCQPSGWKDASVAPVCVVSALFLHSLVWAWWDFLFAQQESSEVFYCHITSSNFLAGWRCVLKGFCAVGHNFFQTSSTARRSNFWV